MNIPYELNYIKGKNIYNNEIEVYVYCGALDVGNTSSQNYEETRDGNGAGFFGYPSRP